MKIDRWIAAVMTSLAFLAVLTLGPESRGQTRPGTEKDRSAITPAQAKLKVDEITKDLREARSAASRISDRALRERIEGLLSRTELRARDLADELARARPNLAGEQVLIPLKDDDFKRLLKGLQAEPFDQDKLIYIQNFASKVSLSCQQAASLLRCFAFDEKRIEAIKPIYKNLIDPHHLNDVLAVYAFPSSRVEARKAVGLK